MRMDLPQDRFAARHLAILLVEDNPQALRALTRLLELQGHRVTGAGGVLAALHAAECATFDLVISDLQLPDGDGVGLMQSLVARRPVKGIAVTGYGLPEDIHWARQAGFQKYLVKPVDLRVLLAAIEELTADEC